MSEVLDVLDLLKLYAKALAERYPAARLYALNLLAEETAKHKFVDSVLRKFFAAYGLGDIFSAISSHVGEIIIEVGRARAISRTDILTQLVLAVHQRMPREVEEIDRAFEELLEEAKKRLRGR